MPDSTRATRSPTVRLANDGVGLLAALVRTLYIAAATTRLTYVGERAHGSVGAGHSACLSFAVYTKVMIELRAEAAQNIATGIISGGVAGCSPAIGRPPPDHDLRIARALRARLVSSDRHRPLGLGGW